MVLADFYRRVVQNRSAGSLSITVVLTGLSLLAAVSQTQAQTPQQAAPAKPTATVTAPVAATSEPLWKDLTAAQKQVLQPLAGSWESLSSIRKNKWLAIAKTYPALAPTEQEKVRSRMAEWAALKPNEREQARRNFAKTKKLAPANRAADWEIYQALSPQERLKLTTQGAQKPVGAAVAIKPATTDKLTAVPVTRRTSPHARPISPSLPQVDRNTLLPLRPLQPAAPAPQTPD